jgi:hypothetical protein
MTLTSLDRWKASGLHLAISALIAAVVVTLIAILWYPSPYFLAMGGDHLLRLLIGVDVVIGPLITLIIFDPQKARLRYDLATIALLQLAALFYGGYIMFEARPVYNVFIKDRFETVAANRIDTESLARAPTQFRDLPLTGPRVVAAQFPTSADELMRLRLEALFGGPDIAGRPHLYLPYASEAMQVARSSRPLATLARHDRDTAAAVKDFMASREGTQNLGYVPVKARNRDFAAIVDRATGEIVGYLAVDPW